MSHLAAVCEGTISTKSFTAESRSVQREFTGG
jgi:hypothetical protein